MVRIHKQPHISFNILDCIRQMSYYSRRSSLTKTTFSATYRTSAIFGSISVLQPSEKTA